MLPSGHQDYPSRRALMAGVAGAALATGLQSTAGPAHGSVATRPARPMRVVQIGMQGHYGHVLDAIPKVVECRLVAVAPATPGEPIEKLRASASWSVDTRVFDDYPPMLDEVRPDIVAVFAPYGLNGAVNLAAVRRGCHVISEKPLAATLEELTELRRERDRMKVQVTALLPMREEPAFAAARQAVKDGLIGEPVLISAQKSYRWGNARPDFYKQRKTYGGSALWVGIHAIDFIRSVTGLDYADVTARHSVKVHKDYPECEDVGALLFTMNNGAPATLTFDFLRPTKAASHADDRLRVVGAKGIVEVSGSSVSRCELVTSDAPARELPGLNTGVKVFEDFVDLIREGRAYYLAADEPFRATEVAIRAREAGDARRTVVI